jgi:hypothetical protein
LKEEGERIKMFSSYVKSHPSEGDKRYLKSWKNHYKWKILQAKAQFNSGIIEKSSNKIKASWKVVNSSLGNVQDKLISTPKLLVDGVVIENPKQVANLLNNKFVINRSDAEISPDLSHIPRNLKNFFLTPTSPDEVLMVINSLSNTKAAGVDEIPCSVMKQVGGLISVPFANICNSSFEQGEYPDLLKITEVIPVFKNKGEKTDPSCWRPIAMLSSLSKIIGYSMLGELSVSKHNFSNTKENSHAQYLDI